MAEARPIIDYALGASESAAQLSLALFRVTQTLDQAPQGIADIAEEISLLAGSLQTLAHVVEGNERICRHALFQNTLAILQRYDEIDRELKELFDAEEGLKLMWETKQPKLKGILRTAEGINTALNLELNIIRLAKEEFESGRP